MREGRGASASGPGCEPSASAAYGVFAESHPSRGGLLKGDSLDLFGQFTGTPDLIVTDPPYAFGGSGDEHAISATVAIVLREAAQRLAKGRWMLVMCASSWRSTAYMVESVRGVLDPVRIGTWNKPAVRTKTRTTGWQWASVNVIAFRKGKAADKEPADYLDHILAAPIINGRRAELPPEVADWMVAPFAVAGGLLLDPFAGSGAILDAGERAGMRGVGFEKSPPAARDSGRLPEGEDSRSEAECAASQSGGAPSAASPDLKPPNHPSNREATWEA